MSSQLRPTRTQLDFLRKCGIPAERMSRDEARDLIVKCIERRMKDLATPKQVRFLARFGIDADQLHYRTAQALLDELHANGFKALPADEVKAIVDKHEHPEPN